MFESNEKACQCDTDACDALYERDPPDNGQPRKVYLSQGYFKIYGDP